MDANDGPNNVCNSGNVIDEEFDRDYIVVDILNLPKKQRDSLYLYALYGYSYKEVANFLGISEVAARKNVESANRKSNTF